jgi:hypothetical protein
MQQHALTRPERVALNLSRGDMSPKAITAARHMARDGATISQIAKAIGWGLTDCALLGRLRKLNIRMRGRKAHWGLAVKANGEVIPSGDEILAQLGKRGVSAAPRKPKRARHEMSDRDKKHFAYLKRVPEVRPLMIKATQAIQNEIARGRMQKASAFACVDCGGQARDWDHRDYTKPLEVEPVCRSCNKKRGPGHPYVGAPKVLAVA